MNGNEWNPFGYRQDVYFKQFKERKWLLCSRTEHVDENNSKLHFPFFRRSYQLSWALTRSDLFDWVCWGLLILDITTEEPKWPQPLIQRPSSQDFTVKELCKHHVISHITLKQIQGGPQAVTLRIILSLFSLHVQKKTNLVPDENIYKSVRFLRRKQGLRLLYDHKRTHTLVSSDTTNHVKIAKKQIETFTFNSWPAVS